MILHILLTFRIELYVFKYNFARYEKTPPIPLHCIPVKPHRLKESWTQPIFQKKKID